MKTNKWLIPTLGLLLVVAAACGGGSSKPSAAASPSAPDTIVIKNFAFHPDTLTVAAGATVTVHNEDPVTHTVTANDKRFDTGDVGPGATKTFTAPTAAGSYGYICEIHQYMTGTLVVS